MIIKEIISKVPVLQIEDDGKWALALMKKAMAVHLPVFRGDEYLGMVSGNMIDENLPLSACELEFLRYKIREDQVIYESIPLMLEGCIMLLPVFDNDDKYVGVLTFFDVMNKLMELTINPGGVIILEINSKDYSLTQLANIVEENDAKILGLHVMCTKHSSNLHVTLKVNVIEMSSILQSLSRHNYNVKHVFMDDSKLTGLMNDRFEQLMLYMNI